MSQEFREGWSARLHSFPSVPLPTDDHLSMDRPDFCLGFDEFHVSHELIQECQSLISLQGFTVSINTPYSGCLIPADYYKVNSRVLGLMVEVNRGIYMDEKTGKKTDQFSRIQKTISDCILEPFKVSFKSLSNKRRSNNYRRWTGRNG